MRHRVPSACLAALLLAAGAGPAAAQGHGVDGPHRLHAGGERGGGERGGSRGIARSRAAVYEAVTVLAVTDPAALKAALARLGPSLAGTGGRLLVDADDPTAVAGTAPSHLAILVFDDVGSAGAWQRSPAFKALAAEIGKAGTLQVAAAGGIADPGAAPSVPAASLGPAPSHRTLPDIPRIADICRGC